MCLWAYVLVCAHVFMCLCVCVHKMYVVEAWSLAADDVSLVVVHFVRVSGRERHGEVGLDQRRGPGAWTCESECHV